MAMSKGLVKKFRKLHSGISNGLIAAHKSSLNKQQFSILINSISKLIKALKRMNKNRPVRTQKSKRR